MKCPSRQGFEVKILPAAPGRRYAKDAEGWFTDPREGVMMKASRKKFVLLHKNVRRKRLECCFGAVCQGKKTVFFTGFFPKGAGFSPQYTKFFQGAKIN